MFMDNSGPPGREFYHALGPNKTEVASWPLRTRNNEGRNNPYCARPPYVGRAERSEWALSIFM